MQKSLLRTVLFERATSSVATMFFLAAAIALAWLQDPGLRAPSEITLLIGGGLLLGRAVHRVDSLALSGVVIGIPDHARQLRRTQWIVVALFAAIAFVCALPLGLDWRALNVALGVCAGVLALASFPVLGIVVFVLAFTADNLAVHWDFLLHSPLVAMVLATAAAGLLVHWRRAPMRAELRARQTSQGLADDSHEQAHAAQYDSAQAEFIGFLGDVVDSTPRDPISARRLWIGMGHDPASSLKVKMVALLIACAALLLTHFILQSRWDRAAYFVISAMVAITMFGRFATKGEVWIRTSGEQSLLKLAPAFPTHGPLKALVLRSLLPGIPGDLGVWAGTSAAAMFAGWIGLREVLLAGASLFALLLTCVGLMMNYLAHSRIRKRMWLPMFHLLSAAIGGLVLLLAWAELHVGIAAVGAGMICAPSLLAALGYALRPLQFPAQPDVKPVDWA